MRYCIAGVVPSILCIALMGGYSQAGRSAETMSRGKILFLRCASCHEVTPNTTARTGPSLKGIVGRRVASLQGFSYSPSLKSLSFVWDAAHLDVWLTNPSAVAPGTAMAFAGIQDAAERKAIIDYLETQGNVQ